jgi:hypothetical protein
MYLDRCVEPIFEISSAMYAMFEPKQKDNIIKTPGVIIVIPEV